MIFFLKICQNIQEIFLSLSCASVSWVFVFKEIANKIYTEFQKL